MGQRHIIRCNFVRKINAINQCRGLLIDLEKRKGKENKCEILEKIDSSFQKFIRNSSINHLEKRSFKIRVMHFNPKIVMELQEKCYSFHFRALFSFFFSFQAISPATFHTLTHACIIAVPVQCNCNNMARYFKFASRLQYSTEFFTDA